MQKYIYKSINNYQRIDFDRYSSVIELTVSKWNSMFADKKYRESTTVEEGTNRFNCLSVMLSMAYLMTV